MDYIKVLEKSLNEASDEIDSLRAQLAESQERVKMLREALGANSERLLILRTVWGDKFSPTMNRDLNSNIESALVALESTQPRENGK